MAAGIDVKMVFIFPPTVDPAQLQQFFTRPGVSGLNIVEGTLRGQKIIPLVRRAEPEGVRRSSRLAALPKAEPRQNWIVAATIHYPHPMIEIRKEIETHFGKDTVKQRNFTNYNSMITSHFGNVVTFAEPEAVAAAPAANANDEMAGLEALFGRAGIGGRRRRATRKARKSRKTRKSKGRK